MSSSEFIEAGMLETSQTLGNIYDENYDLMFI